MRNSHGCIAVYDITDRETFSNLEDQIENFLQSDNADFVPGRRKSSVHKKKKNSSGVNNLNSDDDRDRNASPN